MALILASDTKVVLKERITGASATIDPFIALELAVYGGVGLLLLRRGAWRPRPGGMHPIEVLMLALLATVLLSTLFSAVPIYSMVRAGQTLVLVLLARVAITAGPAQWFRPFAGLFLLTTAALTAVGIILPTQKGPLQQDRFNWLATHPVVVGQFTSLAVALGVVLLLGSLLRWGPRPVLPSPSRRALVAAATAVSAAALLATHTRGAAGAAALGVLVATLMVIPARQRVSLALVAAWGALMVAALGAGAATAWLVRDESAENLLTLNSRTQLWSLALSSTLERTPLVGHGLGAIRSIFYAETGLGGGHNALVNVFADLGVLGLAVWLPLVVWPAIIVLRAGPAGIGRLDRTLWLVAFVVLAVNGLTAEGLGATPSMAFTWMLLLAVVALHADTAPGSTRRDGPRTAGPDQPPTPDEGNPPVTSAPPSPDHPTLPASVRAHGRLVVGIAAGIMLLAGVVAFLTTPQAQSDGRLGLKLPAPGNVLLPVPTGDQSIKRYIAQRAQFATSDPVVALAAKAVGTSEEDVVRRLVVRPTESGSALVFAATGSTPLAAAKLANEAMTAYSQVTRADVAERWEQRAQGLRATGSPGQAERVLADLATFDDGVEFRASASEERASTRGVPWRALLAGLLAGLGLASLGVWAVDVARHRRT